MKSPFSPSLLTTSVDDRSHSDSVSLPGKAGGLQSQGRQTTLEVNKDVQYLEMEGEATSSGVIGVTGRGA